MFKKRKSRKYVNKDKLKFYLRWTKMKLLEKIAIIFFDILDKYIHQRNIIKYLKQNLKNLEIFIDIGSHRGSYTDLIINNFYVKKVIMVEPQKNIYEHIKKIFKR